MLSNFVLAPQSNIQSEARDPTKRGIPRCGYPSGIGGESIDHPVGTVLSSILRTPPAPGSALRRFDWFTDIYSVFRRIRLDAGHFFAQKVEETFRSMDADGMDEISVQYV